MYFMAQKEQFADKDKHLHETLLVESGQRQSKNQKESENRIT
jgi:hypothetical protein